MGIFLISSFVAGAGKGKVPCEHLTVPLVEGKGDEIRRFICNMSISMAVLTMSMIESIAPTSWKWTLLRGTLCCFASALPRVGGGQAHGPEPPSRACIWTSRSAASRRHR